MCGLGDFKLQNTPFCESYHAEMDKTPLVPPAQITIYQGLLGSANWIITLGRFDIHYAINTLSRYSMAPREGHMKAMHRVFGYLKYKQKGKILIDIGQPKVREDLGPAKDYDWLEFYPDAVECVPPDRPEPRGKLVTLTCFVDAYHARDQLTRKSVTGINILVNNTPITWVSKWQKRLNLLHMDLN